MDISLAAIKRALKAIPVVWGRLADRDDWLGLGNPQENPDPSDEDLGELYHEILKNFAIQAATDGRDFSHLFKSARGIHNPETDEYTDPQLTFGSQAEGGDPEQLGTLAAQYDTLFETPYNLIIRKLSRSAWWFGRYIGEIDWQRMDDSDSQFPGLIFAANIYDRDPAEYLINPGGHDPGLYRKNHAYASSDDVTKMDDERFLWAAWDSVFENPYGTSMNQSLVWPTKTWVEIWKAWRLAAEKGGTGVWWGTYPERFAGKDSKSQEAREDFFAMMLEMGQKGAGIFHESMNIESGKLDIEWEIYESLHKTYIKMVSLRWFGNETTLAEAEYGTYGAKATAERGISDLQKYDAAWWGACFHKFNKLFCHFNWSNVPVIPRLQLIPLELITPVTPKDQMLDTGAEDVLSVESEPTQAQKEPKEFQASDDEEKEITPPVAIPSGYTDFPRNTPLSDDIRKNLSLAHQILENMPVKEYQDVQPNEAPFVFTVKRFRGYESEMLPIMQAMKDALAVSLDARNEQDAWEAYYDLIVPVFREHGINMTPDIRNDLNISFRQARQNVFNEALYQTAQEDPGIVGLRIMNQPADTHHEVHTYWNGIAIPKEHPELQRGGRLRIPMDFGCICEYEYVHNSDDLTPFEAWPSVYPGETYRYYAQPSQRAPEIAR